MHTLHIVILFFFNSTDYQLRSN